MFGFLDVSKFRQAIAALFKRDEEALQKDMGTFLKIGEVEAREYLTLKVYETYTNLERTVADLRPYIDYYLVDMILQTHRDHILSPDPTTGQSFLITINPKAKNRAKLQKRVDRLNEVLDLQAIAEDTIMDGMYWGEYPLRIVSEMNGSEAGVTDLMDSVHAGSIISVHRKHLPSLVLEKMGRRVVIRNPWEYWMVRFSQNKLYMDSSYFASTKIPYHLRVGRPMFSTLLPQIKDLMSLEIIDVSRELAELSRNSMVNVTAPSGLNLDKQKVYSKYYEKKINRKIGDLTQMTPGQIEQVIRQSGEIKVLLRDAQKGEVAPVVLNQHHSGDDRLSKIRDRREAVTTSTSTPYEMLFGQTDVSARGGIRQFARFQKRVGHTQREIAWSIKRLIAIDCSLAGVDIHSWDDVDVEFSNAIDADELQTLEALDTKLAVVTSFSEFMDRLADNKVLRDFIQKKEVAVYFQELMGGVGAGNIIDPENPIEKEEVEDEFGPLPFQQQGALEEPEDQEDTVKEPQEAPPEEPITPKADDTEVNKIQTDDSGIDEPAEVEDPEEESEKEEKPKKKSTRKRGKS